MAEHPEWDDLVAELARIEERLRDLAYDRLREAAAGDERGADDEKRLSKARRGVERALHALGAHRDDHSD